MLPAEPVAGAVGALAGMLEGVLAGALPGAVLRGWLGAGRLIVDRLVAGGGLVPNELPAELVFDEFSELDALLAVLLAELSAGVPAEVPDGAAPLDCALELASLAPVP